MDILNFFLIIAFLFILITLPLVVVIVALYILSTKFKFTFRISGFYKISNIHFEYENEFLKIQLNIEKLQIIFIWLRIRLLLKGVNSRVELAKNNSDKLIESLSLKKDKEISQFSLINPELKEKYFEILKNKLDLFKNEENIKSRILRKNGYQLKGIDNVLNKYHSSRLGDLLKTLLSFFDIEIQNISSVFEFMGLNFFHNFRLGNLILGISKSTEKKTELEIICIAYDLAIDEFRTLIEKSDRLNSNPSNFSIKKTVHAQFSSKNENNFSNGVCKLSCYNLIKIDNIYVNLKFSLIDNLSKNLLSFVNNMYASSDVSNIKIFLSVQALSNIFKLIRKMINSKKNKKFTQTDSNLFEDQEVSTNTTISVEEFLVKRTLSQLKKLKINIDNLELNILTDNHLMNELSIKTNLIKINLKSLFNNYLEKNKFTLNSSLTNVQIHDLEIQTKLKLITQLPLFSLAINNEVAYDYQKREGSILSTLSSELSNIEIITHTKDLDKILQVVMCIVNNINKIEKCKIYSKRVIEKQLTSIDNMRFSYNNISIGLYSENLLAEVNEFNLELDIFKEKYKKQSVKIYFSPLLLAITNLSNRKNKVAGALSDYSSYYVSNIRLHGFNIIIDEQSENSEITIEFPDLDVILYDDHLIDIIEFVSSFLNVIFENTFKLKYKRRITGYKKRKKEKICLKFPNARLCNYLDYDDIISAKVSDMKLQVDEFMEIPNVKFYHQTNFSRGHKHTLENKTRIIEIKNLQIKFLVEESLNKISIYFGDIFINSYCLELACAISKIVTFYIFFPHWIDYHFKYKYTIDAVNSRDKYLLDILRKDNVTIEFVRIKIEVKDYNISTAGYLHSDLSDLINMKSDKEIIAYLSKRRRNLLTINVTNFKINVNVEIEKKIQLQLNSNSEIESKSKQYYQHIYYKNTVSLMFEEIDVLHETYKLLGVKDFTIIIRDEFKDKNFDLNSRCYKIISHKKYVLYLNNIKSDREIDSSSTLLLNNLFFNFEDVKVFDQTIFIISKAFKTFNDFPFKNYLVLIKSNQPVIRYSKGLNIRLQNFETVINSIDPITKMVYNRLQLKIEMAAVNIQQGISTRNKKTIELSVYNFSFGFDPSQKSGFPLIIIPLSEVNIINNNIRINVPSTDRILVKNNYLKKHSSFSKKFCDIYESDLHHLLMGTKSITLFLNFKYLSTFVKIFEVFWEKTEFLRKKLNLEQEVNDILNDDKNCEILNNDKNNENLIAGYNSKNKRIEEREMFSSISKGKNSNNYNKSSTSLISINAGNVNSNKKNDKRIILTVFDLKIIYLLEFKYEYSNIFKFHPYIQQKGYFGYIFRMYSFSMKYKYKSKAEIERDSLKFQSNLLTISTLGEDNLNDQLFFQNDREIYVQKTNLKNLSEFNEFMENSQDPTVDQNNALDSGLLNKNLCEFYLDYIENEKSQSIRTQTDLPFNYKQTILKISVISFKRKYHLNENNESISISVENLKLAWNKFNKDVIQLLLFDDILLIVDKIILKVKSKNKGNSNTNTNTSRRLLDLGKFNFEFELNNPQIVIQNELTKSTLLLTNNAPCKVIITKLCINESSKDFKLEVINDKLVLYNAPNLTDSDKIYWIGNSNENIYYLEETLFKSILNAPEIRFNITQKVKSREDLSFETFTYIKITVDKIAADFEKAYFVDFLNIIEVFIFDRGYTLADQKNSIDAKKNDLQCHKLSEIEKMLKSHLVTDWKKSSSKEIEFTLNQVSLKMSEGGRPKIELILRKFDGEHLIFPDKGSNSRINIKDLNIRNIECGVGRPGNTNTNANVNVNNDASSDILLAPLNYQNLGDFEDRINILTFRKKDSYISNTKSGAQWYTLDYFELSLRPLRINISKAQIEFIVNFFFLDANETSNEDVQRSLLINTHKFKDKDREIIRDREIGNDCNNSHKSLNLENTNLNIDKNLNTDKTFNSIIYNKKDIKKQQTVVNVETEQYPIYFRQFKVNDTELLLNFEYAEGSALNLNNAIIKFSHFDKLEKFYPMSTLVNRFISHCKRQCLKNISSLISSLFSQGGELPKNKDENDAKHRKLLFGKK